ncbi:hypothetical protein AVEN_261715-1 [Araneus ventricosus]|uniref:Uncharacterized protein n=1 Tax=Araneus ventricosus TaxID=182803 RepID=A0A4Y2DY69_ARAVE|nr:hypothetical protein AVEN_261715-1 [Araneus ventricosus]
MDGRWLLILVHSTSTSHAMIISESVYTAQFALSFDHHFAFAKDTKITFFCLSSKMPLVCFLNDVVSVTICLHPSVQLECTVPVTSNLIFDTHSISAEEMKKLSQYSSILKCSGSSKMTSTTTESTTPMTTGNKPDLEIKLFGLFI